MSKLPLSRFKVIDLTRARSGPTCCRMLADFGADVLKIETPGDGDLDFGSRHGPDFQNLHRNKRGMNLDLKAPEGIEILKKLVAQADVLVENYRPDVKTRLGIDYESLRKINPRLIYASISGFGQDGPYRNRPGFDQIAQGMGGLMSITGHPGTGPMRVGTAIADLTAGMYCAMGVLIALVEREESGEGQWVNTSLLEAEIAMLDFQAARWLIGKEVPGQAGNNHPTSIPTGVFQTSDGYMNIAASGDEIFGRLCKALGKPEMAADPAFAKDKSRSQNRDKLNAAIEEVTKTKTSAEWIKLINDAGVPCGPIYTIDQVFADEQVKHLGIATPLKHPKLGTIEVVGQAIHLSRTPWAARMATPEKGEHTDAVLGQLGYDAAQIQKLHEKKVV